MTVGVYSLEIVLRASGSLKEKRQVVRRLKDRLRSRFNVSLAETPEGQDTWQHAELLIVSCAHDRNALERRFESVFEEAEKLVPGEVIEGGREYVDAESF